MKAVKINLLALLVVASGVVKAQTIVVKPGELSVKEVAAQINTQKNPQILDARSNEEYAQHHIPGAVSADANAPGHEAVFNSLSKDEPTYIYAIGAARSTIVANELRKEGFKKVYVVAGGLSSWVGSGYPVTTTKQANTLSKNQYAALSGSSPLVLIDFASRYCPTCKKLIPTLDSLKADKSFKPKIITIEEYDNPVLAHQLGIYVLPTLILYKDNKEVWRKSGLSSARQIADVANDPNKFKPASTK
ncbi:sulfurtransferase [Mucilaginibacter corticis]|uniref:Sulfurtransferase n=1 Tax=Mucilaginibacter corticis TaxID=2597670 RepID=A0A556MG18_9SPHI|nr:rhodanese-like domain-containing protein [Mucilaginibacter corticis]TSJ38820.1 sulfurtransferase [Mucilaginibacter corticis]